MSLRFRDCLLQTDTRELWRGASVAPLTPKAYQLLELLLEQRPKALSKAEIQERLWPKTFVSETNLASLVFEVRAAIGDSARRPRFIRTVRGFGYAFCAEAVVEARPAGPAPAIVHRLYWGEREIALHQGENILGRSPDVAVFIDSTSVSRHHARILVTGREAVLEDMGSKNGTRHRGRRLASPQALRDRDEIRLGSVRLIFRALDATGSTETGAE